MYVIVVGGGKIGYYLSKQLITEGHEVLLMEKDRRRQAALAEELGEGVMQGDGCEVRVMNEAGFGRADVIVAVTGDDEDNLVICQMAKKKFTTPRTVARVNNPDNLKLVNVSSRSPVLGRTIKDLDFGSALVISVVRGDHAQLPQADTRFEAEDTVIALVPADEEMQLRHIFSEAH